MNEIALSRDEARWLAVTAQGLDRRPFRRKPTKAEILATIRKIGCVQLDTISVISRSHETVLWSRLGSFNPALLAELYDPDHALTEYWAHAAAILPVELMPYFRSYMEWHEEKYGWAADPENRAMMDRLIATMEKDGPISSLDFDAPEEKSELTHAWDWYGKKPEREALNVMWTQGTVMLRRRDGFRRVFDLPHRIAPAVWEGPMMSDDERHRGLVTRALSALGVATPRWTADYFRSGSPRHVPPKAAKDWLVRLADEGIAIPVTVPGIDEPVWMDAALVERLELMREGKQRPTLTTLLSPFDNLTWNRPRGEQLWDFHYRIEVYTPAHKRVYGYYSLPILHRGKIVGRLDPSFD
ncbi:MAG TPA: crosslink repair DNA glycosylase YcaQ family protein, partial [Thermomicrobiales bacterium]|nr:crosslink repair DNA glycosylase YcaQ family protein [Thermomicrobiales bacterium]